MHYKENNFTQSIIKYKRIDYGGDSDGLLEDINVILTKKYNKFYFIKLYRIVQK